MRTKNLIVVLLLLLFPISGFAGSSLNDTQIKEAFSGKTVEWQHLFKTKYGKSFFSDDGSITGIKNGKKRNGKWHVSGDKLCTNSGCSTIESDGNGTYYKSNGSKKVIRMKVLGDGNLL